VSTAEAQDRRRGVVALAWGKGGAMHCARKNGDLETWAQVSGDFEDDAWELRATRRLLGECVGLASSSSSSSGEEEEEEDKLIACSDDGRVQVFNNSSDDDGATLDVEGEVSAFDVRGDRVAVGGREHELSVWSVSTTDREFRSRNVPHDYLDMRRPVWVSAAKFRTEATLLIGTKHRQLRAYDVRAQRRPVAEFENVTRHAVRQLAILDDHSALVADVAGSVQTVDLRTMRVKARYPGPAGSVRGLATHPVAPTLLFAAAGLDRHVHLWDASKRDKKPIASIYCKQRLNALLWQHHQQIRRRPDDEDDDDDDDDDDDEEEVYEEEEDEEEEESSNEED